VVVAGFAHSAAVKRFTRRRRFLFVRRAARGPFCVDDIFCADRMRAAKPPRSMTMSSSPRRLRRAEAQPLGPPGISPAPRGRVASSRRMPALRPIVGGCRPCVCATGRPEPRDRFLSVHRQMRRRTQRSPRQGPGRVSLGRWFRVRWMWFCPANADPFADFITYTARQKSRMARSL